MARTSIKLTEGSNEHPLWKRRGWNPDGRPSGLRGYVTVSSDSPNHPEGADWLWADIGTARIISRVLADEIATKIASGEIPRTTRVPRFKLKNTGEAEMAEFHALAIAGELDLLFHNGIAVGFVRRGVPPEERLIPRLLETTTVL